jgi:hypothetical protein
MKGEKINENEDEKDSNQKIDDEISKGEQASGQDGSHKGDEKMH